MFNWDSILKRGQIHALSQKNPLFLFSPNDFPSFFEGSQAMRTPLLSKEFFLRLTQLSAQFKRKASLHEGLLADARGGGDFEFEDYRKYQPGEDLRHLDWNVYARTEKFYLKRFTREKDQLLTLFIDSSSRMDYGTPSKFETCLQIAAALGYLALQQKTRVKIFTGNHPKLDSPSFEGVHQIQALLRYLSELEPSPEGGIQKFLRRTRKQKPQSLVVLSDLFEPQLLQEFQRLLEQKLPLVLLQVLAPEEEHPPFLGPWKLSSKETGESREILLSPLLLQKYKAHLSHYQETLKRFCNQHRLPFLWGTSNEPLESWIARLQREGTLFWK